MRLLTWNINGLRAVLKRKYGSLKALLDDLGADIICFQETKLTKADFDRDLALVEGWDSYFSINRGRSAYSGTATFCRQSAALAVAAQEGVTGILHRFGEPSGANDLFETGACDAAATVWQRYSSEELELIDAEGRCVVSDHGAFVLFNVYGPAISSEENAAERFAFKLEFYKALGVRMQALRARGRRIVLVGDLNISPAPLDNCEPGPDFLTREDRVWLRNLLSLSGGPFIDVFRVHHPDRKDAYTCWQQASGARVNNWGTRIDLILAADGISRTAKSQDGLLVSTMFSGSDIWPELTGSDHCPCWADIELGRSLPVPSIPPALSTRNIFTGKQNKLTAWLQQQQPLGSGEGKLTRNGLSQAEQDCSSGSSLAKKEASAVGGVAGGVRKVTGGARTKQKKPVQSSLTSFIGLKAAPKQGTQDTCSGQRSNSRSSQQQQSDPDLDQAIAASLAEQSHTQPASDPSVPLEAPKTLTRQEAPLGGADAEPRLSSLPSSEPPDRDRLIEDDQREDEMRRGLEEQEIQAAGCGGGSAQKQTDSATAAAAWKQIHDRMKPPACKGHNEPCVIRQVKKKGPNCGRLFYVCNRADGPPPKGRCDHFVWSGTREMRGSQPQKTAGRKI